MIDVEKLLAELTARVDLLEAEAEERDAAIEELRYAGPVTTRAIDPNDYDDLIAEEWDL